MTKSPGNGCVLLASPNAGNANNVRNVNPDGNVNNNNANNSNGVAPDCENSQIVVNPQGSNPAHSRKERLSCSKDTLDEHIDSDAVGIRAGTAINRSPKEIVCSFEALYRAAQICKQNVLWKDSVAGFIKNLLINCYILHNELMSGTYRISKYSIFIVHEKKTRLIVSTRMRDRVVQRSLCDNYLYEQMTKGFIYDSCACLKGKGTDMARNRLKCHLQRFYRKHKLNGYVLKVDIHDYFGSTPHDVVKAAVAKRIPDDWARQMVFDIVDSYKHIDPDKGMGLGSQITQLVELAVLDDLDHYIKERLRIKGYVRYMDDFILIHEDKEHLKVCQKEIEKRLNDLGLELNHKKTGIQPISQGVHFLGFSFRLTESGKVLMILEHKKVSKERRKLKKLSALVKSGEMTKQHADDCYNAWKAHASKGNCKTLIARMDAYYNSLFEDEPNPNSMSVTEQQRKEMQQHV